MIMLIITTEFDDMYREERSFDSLEEAIEEASNYSDFWTLQIVKGD